MITIEYLLSQRQLLKDLKIIQRDYSFSEDILKLRKIVVFVWPRRVWKTYLMFQFLKQLIDKKLVNWDNVIYIDFSIWKNEEINFFDLDEKINQVCIGIPFLIFDEVQDVLNREKLVLYFYSRWYNIFVSWSNSKVLSSELATQFRWRVWQYFVYPLTFQEFLRFKWKQFNKNISFKQKGEYKKLFLEYIIWWNFPEISVIDSDFDKLTWLKDFFDVIILNDVMERYNLTNEYVLRYLSKKAIKSIGKQINLSKIYNDLKSQGVKVGPNSVYEYFQYLQNVFFITILENYFKWWRKSKVYLFNPGLIQIFNPWKDLWQRFENIIYLYLVAKFWKVFYKSNWWEIDFYIPDEDLNIQVCWELSEENITRETEPLLKQKWEKVLIYFEKNIWNNLVPKSIKVLDFFQFLNF